MLKRMLIMLLTVLMLCVGSASAGTFRPMQVTNCNEYVTLREDPDSSSAALQRVYVGEVVMADSESSHGFTFCCYNGEYGYIQTKRLDEDICTWSEGYFRVGNCEKYINLRRFPIAGSDSIAKLKKGVYFDMVIYHDDSYDPEQWVFVVAGDHEGFTKWRYVVPVY